MHYQFPCVPIPASGKNIREQMLKVCEEAREACESWSTPSGYIGDTVAELLDTIHACETALRMIEDFFYVDVDETAKKVIKKNLDRGYYDERTWNGCRK